MCIRHESALMRPDFSAKLNAGNNFSKRIYVPARPYPLRSVVIAGLIGPLLASAPYFWAPPLVIATYVTGFVPALIGGALFALWLQQAILPPVWKGAVMGALFGAGASALLAIGYDFLYVLVLSGPHYLNWDVILDFWPFAAFFSLHGGFAGAVIGADEVRVANRSALRAWEGLQPFNKQSVGETS